MLLPQDMGRFESTEKVGVFESSPILQIYEPLFDPNSHLYNDIPIAHKCYIAHSVGFVDTSFRKTGFGKQIQMDGFIRKQSATPCKGFQDAQFYFFIRPLTLGKKGRVPVLLSHNIYLGLTLHDGIIGFYN